MARHTPGYKPDITDTSLQGILDFVARHLYSQDAPSMAVVKRGESPSCAYRGNKRRMCAVGVLIADEHYEKSMEGRGSRESPVHRAVVASLPALSCSETSLRLLLTELQIAHDSFMVAPSACKNKNKVHDTLRHALKCFYDRYEVHGLACEQLVVPAPE